MCWRQHNSKRAAEITGQSEGTLRNFASLAGQFKLSARADKLSYRHHYEAASIKTIGTDKDGKLYLTDEADQELP